MQVDLTAPADNFDADAFTRGVERMLEIIPRNDDVRLDVTTDLRASVRAKHPNREYAATYESDRDMATAMGKTLAQVLSAAEFGHAGAVLGGHRWVGYERRSK